VWQRWVRRRWFTVLLGLVVGALVGFAMFQSSRLAGQSLYILCGTTAGGVAAIVIQAYARSFQLTEVTVSVPQFSELRFAVTNDNRLVAWRLFVEATTRVSTQPLDGGAGLLREAMTSLYTLFVTTREVLAQAEPSRRAGPHPTVEHLAIAMLNNELRPFLSAWHPRLREFEKAHPELPEARWPDNAACRTELTAMANRLIRYVVGFGELARVPNLDEIMSGSM
jgi:hypothetical protein